MLLHIAWNFIIVGNPSACTILIFRIGFVRLECVVRVSVVVKVVGGVVGWGVLKLGTASAIVVGVVCRVPVGCWVALGIKMLLI